MPWWRRRKPKPKIADVEFPSPPTVERALHRRNFAEPIPPEDNSDYRRILWRDDEGRVWDAQGNEYARFIETDE